MRRTGLIALATALGAAGCAELEPPVRLSEGADGAPMVHVRGGGFVMGSDAGNFDERPPHRVHVEAFRIDRDEVTNQRFARFVAERGYRPEGPWRRGFGAGEERHPVRYVSWRDAREYCAWASKRLPTEAEWELAARGRAGRRYPWGDAWETERAHADQAPDAGCVAVGSYPEGASLYGAYDMAGNVWEWVADWYDRWLYRSRQGVTRSPSGPPDGAPPEERFVAAGTAPGNERSTLKVIRGGGWAGHGPEMVRSAKRMFGRPDAWFDDTGFRCAAEVPGTR